MRFAEIGDLTGEKAWPLKLVDRGYDVWMASNRGTAPYSDKYKYDGPTEEDKQRRWDFSLAEMGKYDQPAFFDKVIEVTGQPKVTYIGYSQGTAQMFYALGTQDYLNDKIQSLVLLAPCLYGSRPGLTYESNVAMF